MTLYYKYIWMPPKIENMKKQKLSGIFVGNHAFEAMEDEGIEYFTEFEFCGKDILECEILDGKIKELAVVLSYNKERNIHIILSISKYHKNEVQLKTVYLRDKDSMYTINKTDKKYYRPKNLSFEIDDKFTNFEIWNKE